MKRAPVLDGDRREWVGKGVEWEKPSHWVTIAFPVGDESVVRWLENQLGVRLDLRLNRNRDHIKDDGMMLRSGLPFLCWARE